MKKEENARLAMDKPRDSPSHTSRGRGIKSPPSDMMTKEEIKDIMDEITYQNWVESPFGGYIHR